MSLFSRVVGFFRGVITPDVDPDVEAVAETIAAEFGEEDELVEIWRDAVEDNISDAHDLKEFTLDQHGAELFRIGWADGGDNEEDCQNARDEFFELMEMYDISRDEFDWDAWRDWYEDA